MKAPATPDAALVAGLDRVWALLDAGVADRASPLRQLVVATAGPDARAMVVRGCDRATATLRFHGDRRAGKMAVLAAKPRVAITGYDAGNAIQLRLHGDATIETEGERVERSWAATVAFARRAYMTRDPPGSPLAEPGSGLPDTPDEAFARANFAVITVALNRIEWLHLAHGGHRRAVHARAGGWAGTWLVP